MTDDESILYPFLKMGWGLLEFLNIVFWVWMIISALSGIGLLILVLTLIF